MDTIDAAKIVERGRAAFRAGKTRSYEARVKNLKNMQRMLKAHRQEFIDALHKDLRKPSFETISYEILMAENEIVHFLNMLKDWMKPEKTPFDIKTVGKIAFNQWEPLGLSLIIGSWNYPFQVTLQPLNAAIVAGNTAILKPSEVASASALLLEKLIPQYLDNDCYQVVNGDAVVTTALLEQQFDHIIYTGSKMVGKIIMAAAAKHVTPVTLEMGGKCPCYFDTNCDLEACVKRVTWGRFMNCGQTCLAPDYILCDESMNDKIIDVLRKTLAEFYGPNPKEHPDYARVINQRHFKRVMGLMEGQNIVIGGESDESDLYIAPTVVLNPKATDKVMTEEIFGPIFPIYNVSNAEEAITFINDRERPLALYAFSRNTNLLKRIANETSSGAFVGNDCMMHSTVDAFPFGGVGASGIGAYHGKFSFENFSHKKPVLIDPTVWFSEAALKVRYPPYTPRKEAITNFFMTKRSLGVFGTILKLGLIGVVLAIILKVFGVQKYLPWAFKE